ncbi:LuxR C-terminal-related transcriptional regulator [Anoxybacillus sp. D401a]|uniref:LuxR C-terminal-related transcriptional regulator n=1 Tax=Anoxybacillus sp. D401a TaxID=575112 RepID=UPI003D3368B3
MNCTNLFKTTISCFEQQINRPIVLVVNNSFIFSNCSSEDVKYFFYKNESMIKRHIFSMSETTIVHYDSMAWIVYPIQTDTNHSSVRLLISHPYHSNNHMYVECLIDILALIVQKKYSEQQLAQEIEQLSERERQIFFLLLKGYSNQEIADELVLTHISHLGRAEQKDFLFSFLE